LTNVLRIQRKQTFHSTSWPYDNFTPSDWSSAKRSAFSGAALYSVTTTPSPVSMRSPVSASPCAMPRAASVSASAVQVGVSSTPLVMT
jgi:hypothetical protein